MQKKQTQLNYSDFLSAEKVLNSQYNCTTNVTLNSIIEALESFQNFEPAVRRLAIALHAAELGISEIHFYVIASHAGLVRGVQ